MRKLLIAILLCLGVAAAQAVVPVADIRFHCASDSVLIQKILDDARGKSGAEANTIILNALEGMVYSDSTLSSGDEALCVNLHEGNDFTLMQTVVALRSAMKAVTPGWRHFADELESVRYRKGEIFGFPSRLMYMSEWISENTYRGHIKEITREFPSTATTNRSLTYYTTHRNKFPQMADDMVYDRMRDIEMGLRQIGIPYLKKESIGAKAVVDKLQDGDILVVIDRSKDVDFSEIAFVRLIDGKVFLQRFDPSTRRLAISERSADDYFRHEGRNALGYRLVRIAD